MKDYKNVRFLDLKIETEWLIQGILVKKYCLLCFKPEGHKRSTWLQAPEKIKGFTLKLVNCSKESILDEMYDITVNGKLIVSMSFSDNKDSEDTVGYRMLKFAHTNYTSDFEDSEEEREFYGGQIPGFRD